MKTELKNRNPEWTDAVEEANGIVGRIDLHQGDFDYFSSVMPGLEFRLVIRPMKEGLKCGQPNSWQHTDLFHLSSVHTDGKLHIARYSY